MADDQKHRLNFITRPKLSQVWMIVIHWLKSFFGAALNLYDRPHIQVCRVSQTFDNPSKSTTTVDVSALAANLQRKAGYGGWPFSQLFLNFPSLLIAARVRNTTKHNTTPFSPFFFFSRLQKRKRYLERERGERDCCGNFRVCCKSC